MILVSLLITLALDRMLLWHRDSAINHMWGRFLDAMASRLPAGWDGIGGGLILILPPVVVMAVVQWLVAHWLFGVVSLVLSVVVLLFMLGPLDVVNAVDDYIEARRTDDTERSDYYYERVVGEAPPPGRGPEEGRQMARAVLFQGHDHLFATLFWFCILGPMGAVFYRVAAEAALRPPPSLIARPALGRATHDIAGVLGWIPARLLAFGYAMTGGFEAALRRLRAGAAPAGDWLRANQDLLAETGTAALRDAETDDDGTATGERRRSDAAATVEAARSLVFRAGIFWLAILALLTLAGWFA